MVITLLIDQGWFNLENILLFHKRLFVLSLSKSRLGGKIAMIVLTVIAINNFTVGVFDDLAYYLSCVYL